MTPAPPGGVHASFRTVNKPIYVQLVDCRSISMNGIGGLLVGYTANTIKILTEGGRVITIPMSWCKYYVSIDRCMYLVSYRKLRRILRKLR